MIGALILLWLLCGLLGAIIIREHDGHIPLLLAMVFILAGLITLAVILGQWLMDIQV